MAPQHGPRRARIAYSDSAAKQLENITSEAEIHALARAPVVISVDPDIGGHTYTLDGRSTVRVHTGTGPDSRHDLYQDRRAYVWNSTCDTATLRNDHHRFVDSRSWGHRHH
ncbi:hypothetical protein [Streptomyces sp. NPDC048106]|uniref:hypothetical protein n=1 Tax=Streptomyces sp. NPDC048106 TaxID=3155750 RepID=UPI0034527DCC